MSYDPLTNLLTQTTDTGVWAGMNSGTRDFTYDARGNVTGIATVGGDVMSFTYDLSDQPAAVSGTHNGTTLDGTTYVYDGNMKRAKAEVDGENIYTLYSAEGVLLFKDRRNHNGVRQDRTEYIQGPAGSVARVTRTGETDAITFLHNDHLGSASVATDDGGNELWTESYTPYGEALVNNAANDNQPGFTGHIKDKATGLNYMQARYYDPVGARFASLDRMDFMTSGMNPNHFGGYHYAYGDPVNKIDPNGEAAISVQFDADLYGVPVGGTILPVGGGVSGGVVLGADFHKPTFTSVVTALATNPGNITNAIVDSVTDKQAAGLTASARGGVGLDYSVGVAAEVTNGEVADLEGTSTVVEIGSGPFAVSASAFDESHGSGQMSATNPTGSVGAEFAAAVPLPVSGSISREITKVWVIESED